MHSPSQRDLNVLAAWAVALADVVRGAVEKSTGMGGGAPAALVTIVADPGLSVEELRRALGLTHPGTVRLVDRLVEQGWIRRERGAGRLLRLEPTRSGRNAERRLAAARAAAVASHLAGMPVDGLHTVAEFVDPVLAATGETVDGMRRLCRLCDRTACEPCPAETPAATTGTSNPHRAGETTPTTTEVPYARPAAAPGRFRPRPVRHDGTT